MASSARWTNSCAASSGNVAAPQRQADRGLAGQGGLALAGAQARDELLMLILAGGREDHHQLVALGADQTS